VRDGWLSLRQEKTGNEVDVPIYLTELPTVIAASPCGDLTFLTSKSGKSYSPNDFSEQFRKWCDDAGLPKHCVFHGLRKLALTRLANAGCKAHQIMAIGGLKTLKLAQHYTDAFDRRKNAQAGMETLAAENKSGRESGKPDETAVANSSDVKVMQGR